MSGVHSFVSLSVIGYQKSGRVELFDIFLYTRKLILKYHIVLSVCYFLIGFVRHFPEITQAPHIHFTVCHNRPPPSLPYTMMFFM